MSKIFNQLMLVSALIMTFTPSSFASVTNDSNVIIFVSFSMPPQSIKGWMTESAKIHAPVVIRGLVNNSFKETLKRLNALVSDNKGGIQLDTMIFKTYQIQKVPAIVVRDKNKYDVIYGDVHLDYALQEIIKRKDALSPIAQREFEKLHRATA